MYGRSLAPRVNISPGTGSRSIVNNTSSSPDNDHVINTKTMPATSLISIPSNYIKESYNHHNANQHVPPSSSSIISTPSKSSYKQSSSKQSDDSAKIRVVVRVRPMNEREVSKGYQYILEPIGDDNHIRVWDPISLEIVQRMEDQSVVNIDPSFCYRQFSFDRCLWSSPPSHQYPSLLSSSQILSTSASQDDVFHEIGKPVLDWILGGYNCSVIAFGQTGAGKSFTMMGNINDEAQEFGLIPRLCFCLFESIESDAQSSSYEHVDISDEIFFSHLEIYNETIRDLLIPSSTSSSSGRHHTSSSSVSSGIKIREDPRKGVFLSGLTTIKVTCFEEVMSLIAMGESNRTVAATNSNLHSSRSHAIVTLTVNRRIRHESKHHLPTANIEIKSSQVHLVDLAGSERVTLSGAEGTRLKEANNINRSLSVLGDVIKCLGDNSSSSSSTSSSSRRQVHVPYRNSHLTMVLKNSLGGNAHAVMVVSISPTSNDYEETLSTLKYAERTKRVRMHVEANVSSGLHTASFHTNANELVPILQAEVQKLREILQMQQQTSSISTDPSLISGYHDEMLKEMHDRVIELEKQLEDREKLISSLKHHPSTQVDPIDIKLSSLTALKSSSPQPSSRMPSIISPPHPIIAQAAASMIKGRPLVVLASESINSNIPHMMNLNQDSLFSECLVYYIPIGRLLVGSSDTDTDILLTGSDILPYHCHLYHDANTKTVTISTMGQSDAMIYVNGNEVSRLNSPYMLHHHDRIALGRFHLFRYEDPRISSSTSLSTFVPNWEYAHDELIRKNEKLNSGHRDDHLPSSHIMIPHVSSNQVAATDGRTSPLNSSMILSSPKKNSNGSFIHAHASDEHKYSRIQRSLKESHQNQHQPATDNIIKSSSNGSPSTPIKSVIDNTISSDQHKDSDVDDAEPIASSSVPIPMPLSVNKSIHAQVSKIEAPGDKVAIDKNTIDKNAADKNGTNIKNFEEEAFALQQELSQMQVALQERMKRYQQLAAIPKPNP